MERVFQIAAVILAGIAAFFLWRGETESVFVSIVLCAVAYLVSLRFKVRARIKQRADAESKTADHVE
ncbi:MAG: hypothetical protein ACKVQJ_15545 [Pyrinomonadaceae bacterium]